MLFPTAPQYVLAILIMSTQCSVTDVKNRILWQNLLCYEEIFGYLAMLLLLLLLLL